MELVILCSSLLKTKKARLRQLTFVECLPRSRHCVKHFAWISSVVLSSTLGGGTFYILVVAMRRPEGLSSGLQGPAFAQSWGVNNHHQWNKERRPRGNMKGCCRHEPRPLISQRRKEVQSSDDVAGGPTASPRQGLVSWAELLLHSLCLCVSQTLLGSWELLPLNPLSFL